MDTEIKFNDGIILYIENDFGKYVTVGDYLLIEDIPYRIKANKSFDIANNKWLLSVDGYRPKMSEERKSDDYVSRQMVKDGMIKYGFRAPDMTVTEFIEDELSPVTPIYGICKNCKQRDPEEKKSDDCIARQPLIDNWKCCADMLMGEGDSAVVMAWVFDAPPVTPIHGTCKNCNHRDPEDKKCDCGHDIMWQLPRPDDWYCKDFEKRRSEE